MTFTVYHMRADRFRELSLLAYDGRLPRTLEHFIPVARVDVSCLGETLQVTNDSDSHWTENPQVVALFTPAERTRSTSVGDLMRDDATGLFYQRKPMGWSNDFTL